MKNQKLILLILVISIPFVLLSQDWENAIDLNTSVSLYDQIDLFTNEDGNHVIVQESGELVYYLFSISGSEIRSTTIDNNVSEYPKLSCITGYHYDGDNKVYVIYKKGGYIYTKKTTDAGQNWTSVQSISMTYSVSNGMEVWSDGNGVHLVWSEGNEVDKEEQIYDFETNYRRLGLDDYWTDSKQVTDNGQDYGGHPSVTTSSERIHVAWTEGEGIEPYLNFGDSKSRDKYSGSWQTPLDIFDETGRSYVIADSDKLHAFYYDIVWGSPYYYNLYHTTMELGGEEWGEGELMQEYSDLDYNPVDMALSNNNHIHIVIDQKKYNEWDGEEWDDFYTYTTDTYAFNQKIAADGDDIYVLWITDDDGYTLKLRQRDYTPLAPQNLVLADTVNNHPKITWTSVLDAEEFDIYRAWGNIAPLEWDSLTTTSNKYYIDEDVPLGLGGTGPHYVNYKVKAIDYNDNESGFSDPLQIQYTQPQGGQRPKVINDEKELLPTVVTLFSNYPNPFNPNTTIQYFLPNDQHVELSIYSISGEKINTLINSFKGKGYHKVVWDGHDEFGNQVASGMYFYKIKAGSFRDIKKMVLLR